MKLRGTTGFQFNTELTPEDLSSKLRSLLAEFQSQEPAVRHWAVELDEDSSIRVEVVLSADSFAFAEAAMQKLRMLLERRLGQSSGAGASVEERSTELVPA